MRLAKLALRMVVTWRRSIHAAVAATVAVTAIATLAASIVVPLRVAVTERYRVRFEGELAAAVAPSRAEGAAREAEASGALVSLAVREAATLDTDGDLMLVRLVRTDLPTELAFRALTDAVELASLSPNDAVLLTRNDDGTERAVGRVSTRDSVHLVRIVGVAAGGPRGAELLVHDPAALPGGAASAAGVDVDVRVRGSGGPVPREARDALVAQTALEATGWRESARKVLAPVSRSLVLLTGILSSLAVGTLVPGQLLLVRRAGESLQLLRAWGFGRPAIARLVTFAGAFSGGLAGTAGAALGLAAAAILNAQGRPAVSLLPAETAVGLARVLGGDRAIGGAGPVDAAATLDTAMLDTATLDTAMLDTATLDTAIVTPSVGWALACAAVATLLGAVTALPSARVAATLDARRDVWHW